MEGSASPSSSQSQPQASDQQQQQQLRDSEMEIHPPPLLDDAPNVWDWGDLLDFTVDDDLAIHWDSGQADPPAEVSPEPDNPGRGSPDPGRVRKRDPRLTCSNFLAGRVPCACPELDEQMMELEEDEAGRGNKKKARTVGRSQPGGIRCQVPACGADIRELKGYHRRHRVCLRCANATTVILEGLTKRYCQQCGK